MVAMAFVTGVACTLFFLRSPIDAHLHVWHCTLQLNDPSLNDLSAV